MNVIIRIITLSVLSIIILLSLLSCTPSISQEEYDSVKNELDDYKSQLAALQDKLTEPAKVEGQDQDLNNKYEELKKQYDMKNNEIQTIKSEFEELNTKYEQLKGQDDARISEIQAAQVEYDKLNNELEELNKEYEELKSQYDIIAQGTANLTEEEINQAIFELINQERKNNGVDELIWGTNLYKLAEQNSRKMAEEGEYQYSDAGAIWQQVFMATRYGTLDQLANAALITWKSSDYRYSYHIINPQAIYGAVATKKSGEVYYITYISSVYK